MTKFTYNILQNHLLITFPKFFIQYVELVYPNDKIVKEGFILLSKYRNSVQFNSPIFIHCVTNSNVEQISVEVINLPTEIPHLKGNSIRIFMETKPTKFNPSIILSNEQDLNSLEVKINEILKTQQKQLIDTQNQKDEIIDNWLSVFSV